MALVMLPAAVIAAALPPTLRAPGRSGLPTAVGDGRIWGCGALPCALAVSTTRRGRRGAALAAVAYALAVPAWNALGSTTCRSGPRRRTGLVAAIQAVGFAVARWPAPAWDNLGSFAPFIAAGCSFGSGVRRRSR